MAAPAFCIAGAIASWASAPDNRRDMRECRRARQKLSTI
ncbi:hypothetical protein PATSB16_21370 [Pandoraea thiooxydans]|nr:hypothetical protein PATSB16_21370 [Pandoraea thiooxydans]